MTSENAILAYAGELRREGFLTVLRLARERKSTLVVETGTMRKWPSEDGASTLIFSLLTDEMHGDFTSYDIDPGPARLTRQILTDQGTGFNVSLQTADSITLGFCNNYIDLLYLDSYDYVETNPGPSQRHQMAELAAAWCRLSKNAIVMMDDATLKGGGKGGISREFLRDRGWKCVYSAYNEIWVP
jgi:predicted O-methyltransferase YrrM